MADLSTSRTVLLVDDSSEVRQVIAEALHVGGYEVVTASNGLEGLQALGAMKQRPCLVLLDWQMPVMDGRTFLERVQADLALVAVPVLVFSSNVGTQPPLGAVGLLSKFVGVTELLDAVAAHCR